MKAFKFYSDPGHGWLAVKRKLIEELGIATLITSHSYARGATVYLEEDCDVGTFVEAYKAEYGERPATVTKWTNKTSPIRSYARYRAPSTPLSTKGDL
jgi:hypothetical protein